jgi:hypothetical protein
MKITGHRLNDKEHDREGDCLLVIIILPALANQILHRNRVGDKKAGAGS